VPVVARALLIVAVLGMLSACALTRREPLEQRTTQGPKAEEFWSATVMLQNRREPNFEERRAWEVQTDDRIAQYLRQHPEAANDVNVSTFRFLKQVAVGMDKEQVQILLGPPAGMTTSASEMETAARGYWPMIKERATEAWSYSFGWTLYFSGARLVDITQYLPGT
jgi:hypothetical protein